MRGWLPFWRTSVRLGLRHLARHGYLREAVVRVVVPLDPSRYVELPWAADAMAASPGERVLDLASPKLFAVELARRGAVVTTVDELESEIAAWRRLTAGTPRLELLVGDGRSLPFPDAAFDHASSLSVLEHVAEDGDVAALGELARCVRPGGRVVVTLPHAAVARDEYRDAPTYVDHGADEGRWFFQRWYDEARIERLAESVPALRLAHRDVAGLRPNLSAAYTRTFPLLVPLGPVYGLLARERVGPGGDVARLVFERV